MKKILLLLSVLLTLQFIEAKPLSWKQRRAARKAVAAQMTTQNGTGLAGVKVYLNPGHGGWEELNDRHIPTMPFPQYKDGKIDTLGFWESSSNLKVAYDLRAWLEAAGATVKMSRLTNQPGSRDHGTTTWDGSTVNIPTDNGEGDRPFSVIKEEARAMNADILLSIHSNAATIGNKANYVCCYIPGKDGTGSYTTATETTVLSKVSLTYATAIKNWQLDPLDVYVETEQNGYVWSFDGEFSLVTNKYDGCDTFDPTILCEASFHSYLPNTHRFLNRDYQKQEAFRFYLAFCDIFSNAYPATGVVCGDVRHNFLPAPQEMGTANGKDKFLPINGAKVQLIKGADTLQTYTTDQYFNGLYFFYNVAPGTYNVRVSKEGFVDNMTSVTVGQTKENILVTNNISLQDTKEYPITSIKLNKSMLDCEVGETTTLSLTILPDYTTADKTILWKSNNETVATVSDGVITAHAAGSASIFATCGGLTDSCIVTVIQAGADDDLGKFNQWVVDSALTVRRALAHKEYIYVLAINAKQSPFLFRINGDGTVVQRYNTSCCQFRGHKYAYSSPYSDQGIATECMPLGDIAITDDGVLIGSNFDWAGYWDVQNSTPFRACQRIYRWSQSGMGKEWFTSYVSGAEGESVANFAGAYIGSTISYVGSSSDGTLYSTIDRNVDPNAPAYNVPHYGMKTLRFRAYRVKGGVKNSQDRTGSYSTNVGSNYTLSAYKNDFVIAGSEVSPMQMKYIDVDNGNVSTIATRSDYKGETGFTWGSYNNTASMFMPTPAGVDVIDVSSSFTSTTKTSVAFSSTTLSGYRAAGVIAKDNKEYLWVLRNGVLEIQSGGTSTDLREMHNDNSVTKRIVNGALYLIRNGLIYNMQGQLMR
ncbi:MAG: N-acetylmuramoyl-L-alanine amidase [Paludibacteraceae bacterium]|nr:N-acetylmuramoyl-L-alanine amidase [Paludibacteraceae bacterium]